MISVIVPVYNAEKYLRRCIDSILVQTLTDFELLLIDDGSMDNSGRICDEYAQKDFRVRVFHKENGGVSSARNYGIERISGEYVIQVDSDDWVQSDMLQNMYQTALETQADMVICDFYEEYNEGHTIRLISQRPSSNDSHTVLIELFQHLHGSCGNKLIRRDCYDKYHIRFPHNLNMGEDLYVMVMLLKNPIKVTYLPKAFYYYVKDLNESSIVQTVDLCTLKRRMEIFDRLTKDNVCHEICMRRMALAIANHLFYRGDMNSKQYYEEMRPYRQWLKRKNPPLYGYNIISRIRVLVSCSGLYRLMYWLSSLNKLYK